jgi:hypothetical protein
MFLPIVAALRAILGMCVAVWITLAALFWARALKLSAQKKYSICECIVSLNLSFDVFIVSCLMQFGPSPALRLPPPRHRRRHGAQVQGQGAQGAHGGSVGEGGGAAGKFGCRAAARGEGLTPPWVQLSAVLLRQCCFGCAASAELLRLCCFGCVASVEVCFRQCCFGCVASAVLLPCCFGFNVASVAVLLWLCCFGFSAASVLKLRQEGASAYVLLLLGALPVACEDEQFETDILTVVTELYSQPAKMERCKRPAAFLDYNFGGSVEGPSPGPMRAGGLTNQRGPNTSQ